MSSIGFFGFILPVLLLIGGCILAYRGHRQYSSSSDPSSCISGEVSAGAPITSPLSRIPCVYYRIRLHYLDKGPEPWIEARTISKRTGFAVAGIPIPEGAEFDLPGNRVFEGYGLETLMNTFSSSMMGQHRLHSAKDAPILQSGRGAYPSQTGRLLPKEVVSWLMMDPSAVPMRKHMHRFLRITETILPIGGRVTYLPSILSGPATITREGTGEALIRLREKGMIGMGIGAGISALSFLILFLLITGP